jgi:histidinol-phosphatase (PHP family)
MPAPDVNLHTHTWRCRHAVGDAEEYIEEAALAGLAVLGFADHTALPDGRWPDIRMSLVELDGYARTVRQAGERAPGLRVLLGAECEHSSGYAAWYREELLGARGFDYLVCGAHFVPDRGEWVSVFEGLDAPGRLRRYADHCVGAMRSGLYAFLAHPDLLGLAFPDWDADLAACAEDICSASAALGVPLEMNSYGLRKPPVTGRGGLRPAYPWRPFWEVAARCGARVVISSDAHRPEDVAAGLAELEALRSELGLRPADLPFIPPRARAAAG